MSRETLQTTSHILMVRPANFGYNAETAASNAFQAKEGSERTEAIRQSALEEFDNFVERLRAVGVDVIVAEDTVEPLKPDAVFPNNWVTFHQDGTIVTYPMFAPVRRLERRDDLLQDLQARFLVNRKIQFEDFETVDMFLEGTGSLIIDRPNRVAYACLSPRTSLELFQRFCATMHYEPLAFHSLDGNGQEIYHTNVMMALGETFVIICTDTVRNDEESATLIRKFTQTKKEIIEISLSQMLAFAGNMLQVRNRSGQTWLVMSEQAYRSLDEQQIERISRHTNILYSPIPTIEKYGGGGVRCMMAEVFLEEKS